MRSVVSSDRLLRVILVLVLGVIVLYEEQLNDNTRYRYHMEDNDFKMLLSLEIKS